MTLVQLAALVERNFGPPFLPEGHVVVKLVDWKGEQALSLTIGRRDVCFGDNGTVHGAGTMLIGSEPEVSTPCQPARRTQ